VAIAVVSTNTRELLGPALRSMEPEHLAGRAEVWVVDNASTDGSPEMVAREFPWVRLVALEENVGYGRAVNIVADGTDTPWVAPANEDIELQPGALETLIATGHAHPEAGTVAPRLVHPGGETQHSVFAFPTLRFTFLFNSGLVRLTDGLADRFCIEDRWNPDRAREVDWAVATFYLVRREAWNQVGGFDRDQFMHAEDLALSWTLAERGWKTRYEPAAHVRHVGQVASQKAFGAELNPRYMAATYGWLARSKGVGFARATAVMNWLGAAARVAMYTPLAKLSSRRFGELLVSHRAWLRTHRAGFTPRRELLERR
jgi:N-acetylglucosaminyl-diphospho-decaprenol L-rhamnosyltransferase